MNSLIDSWLLGFSTERGGVCVYVWCRCKALREILGTTVAGGASGVIRNAGHVDVRDVVHIFGGHLAVMFRVCRGDGLSCWGF